MILGIVALIVACVLIIDPLERVTGSLHLFQLEEYNEKNYKKWLENNKNEILKKERLIPEDKSPLVYTDRLKRLLNTHRLVNLLLVFLFYLLARLLKSPVDYIFILLVGVCLYFLQPYVLILSGRIRKPLEEKINMGFYKSAQEKIRSFDNLKVIGITGSYGKTSTKFITSTILKERFSVQDTPSSYNTPMGLSKVINNELSADKEVFIAEMGAYKKGEIKEVADLVQAKIGVLTSIGPAHLESFGSIENIINTKYELIESLPEDGVAIFNYDDENLREKADNTKIRTIKYGIKNIDKVDVYADNIKSGPEGSIFDLHIKNLGSIECKSRLLGKHNINNLLAGCCVAYCLGMSLEEIRAGIEKVEPVEHRLSIINSPGGFTIIDDAFNSNPSGAKAALDVISEFKYGRKIIVTPGMVELGTMEVEYNRIFGQQIADVCDYVILVGKKRTKPIYDGLMSKNFSEDNIFTVDSLDDAAGIYISLLKAGDVLLFENDLPDNYSEVD